MHRFLIAVLIPEARKFVGAFTAKKYAALPIAIEPQARVLAESSGAITSSFHFAVSLSSSRAALFRLAKDQPDILLALLLHRRLAPCTQQPVGSLQATARLQPALRGRFGEDQERYFYAC
jgi:hypothetical protein